MENLKTHSCYFAPHRCPFEMASCSIRVSSVKFLKLNPVTFARTRLHSSTMYAGTTVVSVADTISGMDPHFGEGKVV